jgi:hypothetical protein
MKSCTLDNKHPALLKVSSSPLAISFLLSVPIPTTKLLSLQISLCFIEADYSSMAGFFFLFLSFSLSLFFFFFVFSVFLAVLGFELSA